MCMCSMYVLFVYIHCDLSVNTFISRSDSNFLHEDIIHQIRVGKRMRDGKKQYFS